MYRRCDCTRSSGTIYAYPPHEAFAEEMEKNPSMSYELAKDIAMDRLPDSYLNHPLRQQTQKPAFPVSLYVDGVKVTRTEKILGFWMENIITGIRTLLVAMKHSLMCRCGCRGYDTLHPIMMMLKWSFAPLAIGTRRWHFYPYP